MALGSYLATFPQKHKAYNY